MPNRSAKFASFAFASLLAGGALATIPVGAARAADDCLSAPKDETPAGQHWYYRIEHGSNRHCWYLRDEGDKPAQTASPSASPPANPVATKAETPAPRSIEDAHAELPPQIPAVRQTENDESNPALVPNVTGMDRVQGAGAAEMTGPSSVVVSRWPKPSSVPSAVAPPPVIGNATAMSQTAQAAPSAVAPIAPAAADSSVPKSFRLDCNAADDHRRCPGSHRHRRRDRPQARRAARPATGQASRAPRRDLGAD